MGIHSHAQHGTMTGVARGGSSCPCRSRGEVEPGPINPWSPSGGATTTHRAVPSHFLPESTFRPKGQSKILVRSVWLHRRANPPELQLPPAQHHLMHFPPSHCCEGAAPAGTWGLNRSCGRTHSARPSFLPASPSAPLGCNPGCCSSVALWSSPRFDHLGSSIRNPVMHGVCLPASNPGPRVPCWDPGGAGLMPAKCPCAMAFLSDTIQRISWWSGLRPVVKAAWQPSREEGWK